jgi:hypothetical protein
MTAVDLGFAVRRTAPLHTELAAAVAEHEKANAALRAHTADPSTDLEALAEAARSAYMALGRVVGFATMAAREKRAA